MKMLKTMRRSGELLLVLLLAFLCAALTLGTAAAAVDPAPDACGGYEVIIEDDADLLSADEETNLSRKMREITRYGNVAFKSIDENNRSSTRAYADAYYHERFGTASGTIFLIDMDQREIYVFSDGEIYRTITSAKAYTITDNVYRLASRGKYYDCAYKAYDQILSLLAGEKIAEPMKYICNAILSVITAMILFFILISRMSRIRQASLLDMVTGLPERELSFTTPEPEFINETKRYAPSSSGGGGGSHSGGGGSHSGGGGGHSGGGGGHRF